MNDEDDEEDDVEVRDRSDADLERLTVSADEEGLSIREFLADRLYDISSSGLRKIIRRGDVSVNDAPVPEDHVVHAGDIVSLVLPEEGDEEILRFRAEPLEGFGVLFEDARCIACDKPAGTSVIAERGQLEAPFLGAVLHHLMKASSSPPRPRVVHRIDKETSGVVVLAKDKDALRSLTDQFETRTVEKEYLALVLGGPLEDQDRGEIDLPIGPATRGGDRRSRVGGKDTKPARTTWEVVERFRGFALLRVKPETGRQHQIRVHLEAIGFPLAVDPVYGGEDALRLSKIKVGYREKDKGERPLLGRLSLHAAKITFRSPADPEKPVSVESPLPKDFQLALKQLTKYADPKKRRAPRRAGPRRGHE